MEAALRVVSVERGQDPRFFALICFGGAGGLHACELASGLRIPKVIVPRSPGTLSALGVLLGDVVKDYSWTVMLKGLSGNQKRIENIYRSLEKKATEDLRAEGFSNERIKLARLAAIRYAGQSFEIEVPWSSRVEKAFHDAHSERYGYADARRVVEIVSLRVRGSGVTEKPRLARSIVKRSKPKSIRMADIYLGGGRRTPRSAAVPVFERKQLFSGARFRGPAIIVEYSSTTLLPAGWRLTVDPLQNLVIEIEGLQKVRN